MQSKTGGTQTALSRLMRPCSSREGRSEMFSCNKLRVNCARYAKADQRALVGTRSMNKWQWSWAARCHRQCTIAEWSHSLALPLSADRSAPTLSLKTRTLCEVHCAAKVDRPKASASSSRPIIWLSARFLKKARTPAAGSISVYRILPFPTSTAARRGGCPRASAKSCKGCVDGLFHIRVSASCNARTSSHHFSAIRNGLEHWELRRYC